MKIAVITLTEQALGTGQKCFDAFGAISIHKPKPFKEKVQEAFYAYDLLLFIMATGIVVRTIGPICEHKSKDPGVMVMDEKAKNVISLLSGHIGCANEWTHKISKLYGANPVITTASDVNDYLSIDMLAKKYNLLFEDFEQGKMITQLLIHHKKIQVIGSKCLKEKNYSDGIGDGILYIGHKKKNFNLPYVQLYPKNLVLGIGCKKNTDPAQLLNFVKESLKDKNYNLQCVDLIASAWLKADEKALHHLSKSLDVQFKTYEQGELLKVEHLFKGSDFVKKTTGVRSVALASGYLASKRGELLIDIIKKEGMTLCLWERRGDPCYM